MSETMSTTTSPLPDWFTPKWQQWLFDRCVSEMERELPDIDTELRYSLPDSLKGRAIEALQAEMATEEPAIYRWLRERESAIVREARDNAGYE